MNMMRRIQTQEHFAKKPIAWWKREDVPEWYHFVLELLQKEKPKEVLEVGSGRGAFSFRIRNMGMHVYAVEVNRMFIDYCAKKDDCTNIELVQGNGEMLPFADESFDAVVCIEVLMHVPNPHALFLEVSRVLRPWGYAIISFLQKHTKAYFKKTLMFLSGLYSLKYGRHSFDFRFDTMREIKEYMRDSSLIIRTVKNQEHGIPCLILQKVSFEQEGLLPPDEDVGHIA